MLERDEIRKLVKKYSMKLVDGDKISLVAYSKDKQAVSKLMQEHKPQILQYLKDEEDSKARAERWKKENGIEEFYNCSYLWSEYKKDLESYHNSESGIYPKEPDCTEEKLAEKYPAGFAYVVAERYAKSENMTKAGIYQGALDKILADGDYKKAMTDADEAWTAYCLEHQFD